MISATNTFLTLIVRRRQSVKAARLGVSPMEQGLIRKIVGRIGSTLRTWIKVGSVRFICAVGVMLLLSFPTEKGRKRASIRWYGGCGDWIGLDRIEMAWCATR